LKIKKGGSVSVKVKLAQVMPCFLMVTVKVVEDNSTRPEAHTETILINVTPGHVSSVVNQATYSVIALFRRRSTTVAVVIMVVKGATQEPLLISLAFVVGSANTEPARTKWIVDSGASQHMCCSPEFCESYQLLVRL
jgi:hypothetical protein